MDLKTIAYEIPCYAVSTHETPPLRITLIRAICPVCIRILNDHMFLLHNEGSESEKSGCF